MLPKIPPHPKAASENKHRSRIRRQIEGNIVFLKVTITLDRIDLGRNLMSVAAKALVVTVQQQFVFPGKPDG